MILQNGMENTKYWLENEVKIMKFKKIIKWTEIMNLMDNDEKIKLFKPNGMPINDLLWHDIYFQKKLGKEKKIFFFLIKNITETGKIQVNGGDVQ